MSQLRLDGRVVIVTGAGAGLGKAYALLFASRGASVVVNDLGGGRHGDAGSSTRAADGVVQEIRNSGGKAVADYNSVVDGEKIVQTALDNFGRIDIVVNNAGVLRDKSFPRISNADWDIIHDVHVKGAFKVTQAAWPYFRQQGYGRIILTSSNSGLCGNFGQANYSAAKMGLIGLNNTLAIEGQKYNIKCNTIVPTAASRLTEDILPPDLFAELKPELIAPIVLWLCHESCEETGSIIESSAGWATKVQLVRGNGTLLRNHITEVVSPETVRDRWSRVTDMSNASHTATIEEVTYKLINELDALRSEPNSTSNNTSGGQDFAYSEEDAILYALGIGASVQNDGEMKFLYENDERFSVFPTFVLVPAVLSVMSSSEISSAIPGKAIDFSMVLHGEQYLELYKPIPTSGTLKSVVRIADVLDKGKNAVILTDVDTYDQNGEKVAYSQVSAFILGAGSFNGIKSSEKDIPIIEPPQRLPDATAYSTTLVDQAALYRLSGDTNPLHIDANMATMMGYERPILHGLCTLGFAVRHVLQFFANNNPELFKCLKVRFTKPVLPGQVLRTSMWQEGNRIFFQTTIDNTDRVVLSGGYVDLKKVIPLSLTMDLPVTNVNEEELLTDLVFDGMKERIENDPSMLKKINGVFLYNITKGGKKVAVWTADLKNGKIYKGTPKDGLKVDTTLTIDDSDFADMALGKLNPQVAFIKGKLKIQGNIMLTQKLKMLMTEPKL